MLCACLLLAGAGCAWDVGSTRVQADVRVNEQAVDATLDEAAAKVQRELSRLGLEVTAAPDGDAVRVVSKTKAGDRFAVVLSRGRSASGREQTQVRVEWGARADRELWLGLLLALGASAAQGPG
jgi:hypothetical protein